MLKVASICHMFPNRINPHIGIFVKERLKHVAQKTELTIIAPIPSFPFSGHTRKYAGLENLERVESFDGLQVHHPRYFMIPKYLKILDGMFYGASLAPFMKSIAGRTNFDILDFHWVYPDAIGGLQWARKLGKKTVVTVRGNEAIYYFEKSPIRNMLQQRLREFDHVISVSGDLKRKIVSEFGVEESRVSVISNGIDTDRFHLMDRDKARLKCALKPGKRYLLTVSRLSSEKGLDNLLQAMRQLQSPGADLVIIGDGPLKGQLLDLATRLNIKDRVHFLGELGHGDLCAWYNAVDAFCLPSLWEGCPNVVIEALACGTPVVATSVGGIPDLVSSSTCGILAPPGDERALSAALDQALQTKWNRHGISELGSSNSWTDVADKVIAVFERILS